MNNKIKSFKFNNIKTILEERHKTASILRKAVKEKERIVAMEEEGKQRICALEENLKSKQENVNRKQTELDVQLLAIREFIHEQKKFNERLSDSVNELRKSVKILEVSPYDMGARALLLNMGKSISALSSLSAMRMEMLEFQISPEVFVSMRPKQIYVWREFEKIYKSINNGVKSIRDKFKMSGESTSSVEAPRILTIAIFIILENAWKYVPADEQVSISFLESLGKIDVTVENLGPHIFPDEVEKLTESSYRGENAVLTPGVTGKGLGLGIAKNIFDLCHVDFSINTSSIVTKTIGKIDYSLFTVKLCFHTKLLN